ncbi:MAG: DUF1329 domain-containing protein, partial [Salinisphaera sp.]|nr:DUF1329 domain-containing protein [Salinisphaera sp.]
AIRAGNEAGTIPPWPGGLTTPPPSFDESSGRYANPYPQDEPLFVITAENMAQYADHLTDGQKALLKRWPESYKMPVYKTRRSFASPQWVYDAIAENAVNADLVANGEGISGATGGIPFPFIKATGDPAKAAIWNHKLRFRGQNVRYVSGQIVTFPGDGYRVGKLLIEVMVPYAQRGIEPDDLHNVAIYFLETVLAPPRSAGTILLVHETMNQVAEPRRIWLYNPGLRRIRRAPNVAYDNPGTASDGMRTNDQFDMFNGATDRYNWKVLGKKEIYIPYNSYELQLAPSYDAIVGDDHTNQALMRYELHRVWVVEGTVKPTTSHLYARRKFYIDEDSWNILAADQWDSRGDLWRVMESHTIELYDRPLMAPVMLSSYDLFADRYLLLGLNNEDGPAWNTDVDYDVDYFNPRNIRRRAAQ